MSPRYTVTLTAKQDAEVLPALQKNDPDLPAATVIRRALIAYARSLAQSKAAYHREDPCARADLHTYMQTDAGPASGGPSSHADIEEAEAEILRHGWSIAGDAAELSRIFCKRYPGLDIAAQIMAAAHKWFRTGRCGDPTEYLESWMRHEDDRINGRNRPRRKPKKQKKESTEWEMPR